MNANSPCKLFTFKNLFTYATKIKIREKIYI